MSKNFKNSTAGLRSGEIWGGFLYWPFYLVLTALLVSALFSALGIGLSNYQLNLLVFAVDFIAVAVIFRRFLWDSLRSAGRSFWLFLQTVILALAMYYALSIACNQILQWLHVSVVNGNNSDVLNMVSRHFAPMVICTSLLVPVVEECLCRGLIFGLLHKKSRILAYAVSMLVFSFVHVWQYALSYSIGNTLLVMLTYLPAGLALGWAYEKSGTIWASILTHGCINFISCYVSVFVAR